MLISGEPGLGKSRITVALEERVHAEPHFRLRYFCSPYHQDSALFRSSTSSADCGVRAPRQSACGEAGKARGLAGPRRTAGRGCLSFLADLLSLPVSERFPLPNLSPQRKRKGHSRRGVDPAARGFGPPPTGGDGFRGLCIGLTRPRASFLTSLVERIGNLPILLIATFRPEFQPPWTGQPQVTVLVLNRLDRRNRTALVEPSQPATPPCCRRRSSRRSSSAPTECRSSSRRLTKSSARRAGRPSAVGSGCVGSPRLAGLGVPATLQASLMARLDRLGPAAQGGRNSSSDRPRILPRNMAASVW